MLWLASKSHTFFAPLQAFHAKYIHSSSSTRLLSVQLIRQAAIHNTIDAKCSILSKNNIPLMRVQFRTIKFAELCVNMNLLSFFDSIIQQKPKKKTATLFNIAKWIDENHDSRSQFPWQEQRIKQRKYMAWAL